VFLLALPVMVLLLVLGPRVLAEYRDPDAGRLDLLSAAMLVAAILAATYGLKQIAQDGVSAGQVLAMLAGVAVGVLFVRRRRRLASPMIDVGLFRLTAFNAALATNFLAIFVAVGYFLFVAQYLQLVVGLSPLQAGLWSLPSAFGFIVGSQFAPRIVRLVRPAHLIAGGLTLAAVGLLVLTRIGADNGLVPLVAASVLISLGLAAVFGLTTELIVGSAPPQQAGAASGISETGAELGGALGIAIFGSVGIAVYRGELADHLPAGVPAGAAATARDTLGSAVEVAGGAARPARRGRPADRPRGLRPRDAAQLHQRRGRRGRARRPRPGAAPPPPRRLVRRPRRRRRRPGRGHGPRAGDRVFEVRLAPPTGAARRGRG
jgi:DHA2 family multidrug resistance protein-like MFS transporter